MDRYLRKPLFHSILSPCCHQFLFAVLSLIPLSHFWWMRSLLVAWCQHWRGELRRNLAFFVDLVAKSTKSNFNFSHSFHDFPPLSCMQTRSFYCLCEWWYRLDASSVSPSVMINRLGPGDSFCLSSILPFIFPYTKQSYLTRWIRIKIWDFVSSIRLFLWILDNLNSCNWILCQRLPDLIKPIRKTWI